MAKYLFVLVVLIGLYYIISTKRETRNYILKLAVISIPLALIITLVSSHFYFDPLPFVVKGTIPLFPHAVDNGFPSDHTLVCALATFLTYFANKKVAVILLVLTVLVGTSRVVAQVHHPLDIFGSLLIALISVALAFAILRKRS